MNSDQQQPQTQAQEGLVQAQMQQQQAQHNPAQPQQQHQQHQERARWRRCDARGMTLWLQQLVQGQLVGCCVSAQAKLHIEAYGSMFSSAY